MLGCGGSESLSCGVMSDMMRSKGKLGGSRWEAGVDAVIDRGWLMRGSGGVAVEV
jgi:hypothetical protein